MSGGPAMIPFSLVTSDWSMSFTFIEHAWACMEERVNQNKTVKEVAKWRVGSSRCIPLIPKLYPLRRGESEESGNDTQLGMCGSPV